MITEKNYQELLNEMVGQITNMPWENTDFYANYLAQTYFYVSHSTRLIARSVSLTPTSDHIFYNRSIVHISEENNHEILALRDLKALNKKISDFPELSITKAFYEPQYYKADKSSGISLLGYILFLELIAVHACPLFLNKLKTKYGPKAVNFIRIHSEEDASHVEKAIDLIKKYTKNQQQIIWSNYQQTAEIYIELLNKCSNQSQGTKMVA